MAVRFFTSASQALLDAFIAKISQTEATGRITTWEPSRDGLYYTHKATEWNKRAWFRPKTLPDRLLFNIIKPKNASIPTFVYGYYHGHLTETFLNHFSEEFITAVSTALPTPQDKT